MGGDRTMGEEVGTRVHDHVFFLADRRVASMMTGRLAMMGVLPALR
ncbi:hypothetical protein ACFFMN_43190 [Planobispora siamensis]|uniref:Uncharacterized protein n=1 Tax=Planobispora siamensis TaxID=936338 RepID=A0A8J3SQT3_9ACTN|nr:hypothetical protein [Planobispora siamensis]GIH97649.1 hypothetical protein Psi01_82790 [Planobispora siamensis]